MDRRSFLKVATAATIVTAGGLRYTQAPGYAAPAPATNRVLPAIVIGSGYGGSVAALRLAQAGYETTVLEMGKLWDRDQPPHQDIFCAATNPDERSFWFRDRTDMPVGTLIGLDVINRDIKRGPGPLDKVYFDQMAVYLGRAVGGGSVVNGGMAPTPNQGFLSEKMPANVVNDLYGTYFDRARTELGVNSPPDDIVASSWYQFSRVSADDARWAGYQVDTIPNVYDWDYLREEIDGRVTRSATAGKVIFGNDFGKRSLDKTYLAKANATGNLRLLSLTQVTDIQWDGDLYQVTIQTHDDNWNLLDTTVLRTSRLFVAAGVLGTMELLLRAKKSGGLGGINDELGKGFGHNGNHMLARASKHLTGVNQSSIPIQAINNWGDPNAQVLAEIAPFPAGLELWINLYLAIGRSDQRATFSLDDNNALKLDWRADQNAESANRVWQVFDKINSANVTGYRLDLFGNGTPMSNAFTYHPLGGAILGAVTDDIGRVKGHQGLYVLDGSLIPGQVGVNPFLTITALAERNIESIINQDFADVARNLPNEWSSFRLYDTTTKGYLAPKGGGTSPGTAAVTADPASAAARTQFRLNRDNSGYWLTDAATGLVVTQSDASTTAGSVVSLEDNGAGTNQRLRINTTGEEGAVFKFAHSELNLAGTSVNGQVQQQDAARVWNVTDRSVPDTAKVDMATMPIGATVNLTNVATRMTLNVHGGFSFEGAQLQTWGAWGDDASLFTVQQVGDRLRLVNNRSMMAIAASSADEGAAVIQVPVNDADERQLFTVRGSESGGYLFTDASGTRNLTSPRGAMTLTMSSLSGVPTQRWQFGNVSGGVTSSRYVLPEVGKTYHITNKGSGLAIDTLGRNTSDGTPLITANVDKSSPTQHWEVQQHGEGLAFRNLAADKLMDLQGANILNGTNLNLWSANGTAAQQFAIEGSPGENGYMIRVHASARYVDVTGGVDSWLAQFDRNANNKFQYWYFEHLATG